MNVFSDSNITQDLGISYITLQVRILPNRSVGEHWIMINQLSR